MWTLCLGTARRVTILIASCCGVLCWAQVECLGPDLLPFLGPALESLLAAGTGPADLVEFVALLNQLMARYKDALQDLMVKVKKNSLTCRALKDLFSCSIHKII